ncbi:hypothetical protein Tco_0491473 [Tanacetum coccineum]
MNEGLQAFMDRFESESSYIKGLPPMLRISAFMHGHGYPELAKKLNVKIPKTVDEMFERVRSFIRGETIDRHPELAKKLNDKIPKTMDEIFERVRAFIRGEVAAGSDEVSRAPQWDKGTTRPGWSGGQEKEILAMENMNFPPPLPLAGIPKKQNLNKFFDYHIDRGHNTNVCYHLKKQIEEVVASGKLVHLVKDIHQVNQRNRSQGRGGMKVINMVGSRESHKRPYEMEKPGLTEEITFPVIPQNSLTNTPIILEGTI